MATVSKTVNKARTSQGEVIDALHSLCGSLTPGDRIPTHTELMRRLGASERVVLRALDELQREGRIIRRHGSGTFVADPPPPAGGAGGESLTNRRTVVAITVPDNSFFDRCMTALFRHTEAAGLSLTCRPMEARPDLELDLPRPPEEHPFGFILFQHNLVPLARTLQAKGCRVVVVGAPFAGETWGVPGVYSDHEQGGYLATQHLLNLGHRRLLLAGVDSQTLRFRGHQRAVAEANRRAAAQNLPLVQEASVSQSQIAAWQRDPWLAAALFQASDAPTAVVAWNDHEAAKVSVVLHRLGRRVPQDISLIGYDALPEGELIYPPLTTVDQAMDRQLRAALDLLTQPTPPSASHHVVVLPTLIVRDSCSPIEVPESARLSPS